MAASLVARSGLPRSNNSSGWKGAFIQTVIVTGANTGIGYETAKELAQRGARVIIACRDQVKGLKAVLQIRHDTKNEEVVLAHLDLCSFASVRKFAQEILKNESRLDILINNAGCVIMNLQLTEDNIDAQFQSNHFGHFLLTSLLLPLLKSTNGGKTRIINVSSIAHSFARSLSLDDINHEKSSYIGAIVYGQTKLANILFTKELASRLQGTGITVNALHPGTVDSEFTRGFPYIVQVVYPAIRWFIKDSRKGAQTSVFAAVDPQFSQRSGEYLSDCAIAKPTALACDAELGKKLWELSDKLTGAKW